MGLDRFLTLYCVRPLGRLRGEAGRLSLPILMYHSICDDPPPRVASYYWTCTSPARFGEQLGWLRGNGWRGVTLSDGLAWLRDRERGSGMSGIGHGGGCSGGRPVVLTFDDGFRDFHDLAGPLLSSVGFAATMFLPTGYIGESGGRLAFLGKECMTWDEIRELSAAGVEFGSHTVSHPRLLDLPPDAITRELLLSKRDIEDRIGVKVETFAYPYAYPQANAHFGVCFDKLLSEAGYSCCVTTMIGNVKAGSDLLRLTRQPVSSADDVKLLSAKLAGDYDWLGGVQYLVKYARGGAWRSVRKESQ